MEQNMSSGIWKQQYAWRPRVSRSRDGLLQPLREIQE
jgi:hypothetical protein